MTRPSSARLKRLGIDVWVRRGKPLPLPNERSLPDERPRASERSFANEEGASGAAPKEHGAPPERASEETARAEQPRPAPAPRGAPSRTAPARPEPRRQRPVQPAHGDPKSPPTPFHIRCFHFGGVFAAIGEDAWAQRRLLLDVTLALNGFRPAERQDVVFSWPQPGAPPDGGGRAFRAFFGHRTRDCGVALLSGKGVPPLLGYAVPEQDCVLDGAEPHALYVVPRVLDADAKRTLWRLIRTSTLT